MHVRSTVTNGTYGRESITHSTHVLFSYRAPSLVYSTCLARSIPNLPLQHSTLSIQFGLRSLSTPSVRRVKPHKWPSVMVGLVAILPIPFTCPIYALCGVRGAQGRYRIAVTDEGWWEGFQSCTYYNIHDHQRRNDRKRWEHIPCWRP